ncbi:MAG: hypothetical protein HY577_01745 [Candidatus Nealsonbacteria bacterium]|nr:hypothetical protein [Candidatus Nealsonbacteria bacterium]
MYLRNRQEGQGVVEIILILLILFLVVGGIIILYAGPVVEKGIGGVCSALGCPTPTPWR